MTSASALLRRAARGGWRFASRRATARGEAAISGQVDLPRPMQAYLHWVNVRGWVTSEAGGAVTVRVTAGGRVVADTVLPDASTRDQGQFDVTVPASVLPRRRLALIRVEVMDACGRQRMLGLVPVVRSGGRALSLPRFAYGKVWDRSAGTLSDARDAVAGYADEDEWNRSGASTADNVAAKTRMTTADVVLEIGCGAGRVGTKLASRCTRWIGADVSVNMLRFARAALEQAGLRNVSLVHLNGVDLSGVETGSIDVVYCTAVFMHLDEWDRYRYLVEAFRVLRPGGRLYVDNFDLGSPRGWALFQEMSRYDPAARPANISKASTAEELRIYAEKAGYTRIELDRGALFVTLSAERPP